ncbi:esterase/lipase family protein [Nocardia sp. NPDC057663]|uniref:esterase/lipase family protein n=1 Tax=Nocardia sp. NPDC057663 TaxID=3346201 RepID=UPI00366EFFA7
MMTSVSHEWVFPAAQPDDLPPQRRRDDSIVIDPHYVSNRVIDDVVVVVPGVMGTELIDSATGKKLWGLDPHLIARMWTAPTERLAPLAVDPDRTTVKPGRLLRVPTFAPFLRGIDPYTKLVKALEGIVRHPAAVSQFGYDWRLPVRYNAGLLAEHIDAHASWWRRVSDRSDARVHLVAHSMGGLLCHELSTDSGATDSIGTIITLGTPFAGAAKAAVMLATGKGARLPARQLQQIAVTMPGIYDLLPSYRCVDVGTDVRRLTSDDIATHGGRRDLADDALAHRAARAAVSLPGHRPLVGVEQATTCSLRIDGDFVEGLRHVFDVDSAGELVRDNAGELRRFGGLGDGTVPRNSALPPRSAVRQHGGPEVVPLPQQHGPIAKTDEAIAFVIDVLLHRERDLGPRLGEGEIGIDTPDIVTVGEEFDFAVEGAAKPNDVRCGISEVGTTMPRRAEAHRRDGRLVVSTTVYTPGLYRVRVAGSGTSPVEQLVLAVDTDQ